MSAEVTVRFTGELRTLSGQSSLNLAIEEGATLDDLLRALQDVVSLPFTEQVLEPLVQGEPVRGLLLLNRTLYSGAELDRPVFDGDVIAFVMPMEGG